MRIEDYRFGHIRIDGRDYDSDVIVGPEQVRDHWWRRQGHRLHTDDLQEVVAADPEVVVIGTGCYGRMQVPEATRRFLEERGIEVHATRTGQAVDLFNELQQEYARIVAALHLTC
jgi:hypothetical protein